MGRIATCSLDPLAYHAFFRNGPNRTTEWVAVKRSELEVLETDLETARWSYKQACKAQRSLQDRVEKAEQEAKRLQGLLDFHIKASLKAVKEISQLKKAELDEEDGR